MTMGAPEPYFGGVEDMATSEVAFSRESSFSQGDYIIKTAYASTDALVHLILKIQLMK